jgi:hypothetical protein
LAASNFDPAVNCRAIFRGSSGTKGHLAAGQKFMFALPSLPLDIIPN